MRQCHPTARQRAPGGMTGHEPHDPHASRLSQTPLPRTRHGRLLESLQTAQTVLTDNADKLGVRAQVPVFRFLEVADFFDRFVPTWIGTMSDLAAAARPMSGTAIAGWRGCL
jgi:hypothetical protein